MAQETRASNVLKGSVLLTRPINDCLKIQQSFVELGYDTIISPVIEIEHIAITKPISDHEAILITSQNALHALQDIDKSTTIYCVGKVTAEAIFALGFKDIKHKPTAKDLNQLIEHEAEKQKILYLAGENTSFDFNITKLICYKANPVTKLSPKAIYALKNNVIDLIPLYSKRSAEILAQLLTKYNVDLQMATAVAISREVKESIKGVGFAKIITAENPSHQGIIEKISLVSG